MELIRGLHNLNESHRGCVATIGNFDGVHIGHHAVLNQLKKKALELCFPTTVITFEPQPQEYFSPEDVPPRLTRLREKILAIREHAIDRILCVRFNRMFANLTAEEFIRQVLVDGLAIKYLVVGDDFRFGKDRSGNFSLLREAGKKFGFEVASTATYYLDDLRVSSTRIRNALSEGGLECAKKLLDRHYDMCGRVAHGDKRGRTIGFPTANIYLHRQKTPIKGVFAIKMEGLAEASINGIANIGTRPTVDGTRTLLEVHLFDFDRDIYGAYVNVKFLQKIRDEKRFESFDDLQGQIQKDVEVAKLIHAKNAK